MLKRIEDMPAGTVGFEAHGEVEDDDWEEDPLFLAARQGEGLSRRRSRRCEGMA